MRRAFRTMATTSSPQGHFLAFYTNDPINFVCQEADFLAYRGYYTLCQGRVLKVLATIIEWGE